MEDVLKILLGILLSLIGYIWFSKKEGDAKDNSSVKEHIKSVDAVIQAHIKECNEVPKSLIVEKIENLCSKQDDYQAENRINFSKVEKRFDETRTNFTETFKRLNVAEKQLARIEGAKEAR